MIDENGLQPEDSTTSGGTVTWVASVDDFSPGDRILVEMEGKEIAVFNVDGEYHALLNFCTHQGGPLCEGETTGMLTEDLDGGLQYERDGAVVACPWHGWQFDITTGEHLARPTRYRIPTYEVVVRDGSVYLAV